MRRLNTYSHIPFLRGKLMAYFPEGSIASRLKRTIPAEINSFFAGDIPEDSDYYEAPYQTLFPVRALFEWIVKHGGLTVEDLEDENGQLFDDNGKLIPRIEIKTLSSVEQMAAFGLWFIDSELNIAGLFDEDHYDEYGRSPDGWSEADAMNHKAECLLNASQALWYAERLSHAVKLSADEKASLDKNDFSALGRAGAVVRHGPMNALRAYALSLYNPQEWKSANQAAHALSEKIMDYGRTKNAILQPANAQRTIAGWFRKKSV